MCACASSRLLLLTVLPVLLGVGCGGGVDGEVVSVTGAAARAPVFAPGQRTAVSAVEGRSVTLNCRVLHLGDKAVSWVRVRDLQILSHGEMVFTADARVSVPARPVSDTHALRIERLRAADAGRYECQLNTEPKMSLFFDLFVIDKLEEAVTEPVTEPELWDDEEVLVWAVDADEVTVVVGGTAELACAARVERESRAAAPPLDIRWLRGGKPLVLQDGCAESRLAGTTYAESRLRLVNVRMRDGGEYSCAVGVHTASVRLRVTDEENLGESEAMQRDQSAGGGANAAFTLRLSSTTVLLLILAAF